MYIPKNIGNMLLYILISEKFNKNIIDWLKIAINYYETSSSKSVKQFRYPPLLISDGGYCDDIQLGRLLFKVVYSLLYENKTYKYIKDFILEEEKEYCETLLQNPIEVNPSSLFDVLNEILQKFYLVSFLKNISKIKEEEHINKKVDKIDEEIRKYFTNTNIHFQSDGIDITGENTEVFEKEVISIFNKIQEEKERGKIATTGFTLLDKKSPYGGLPGGRLMTLLGLPGRGKSTTLLHIALRNFEKGLNVLFISLENNVEETLLRMVSNITKQPIDILLNTSQQQRNMYLQRLFKYVNSKPNRLTIQKMPLGRTTVEDIFEGYMKNYKGINYINYDVVVIDYASRLFERGNNKKEQLDKILEKLKTYSVEFNIPVITAGQINREGGKKTEEKKEYYKKDNGEIVEQKNKDKKLKMLTYNYAADSYGIAAESDLVIIIQKSVDGEQSIVYYSVTKSRFFKDNLVVKTQMDTDTMTITELGIGAGTTIMNNNNNLNNENGLTYQGENLFNDLDDKNEKELEEIDF